MSAVTRRSTAWIAVLLLSACSAHEPGVPPPATSLGAGAEPASASVTKHVEAVPPSGAPVVSERRHPADPRALALIRKADALTYRPSDAGLRAVRCKAEYRVSEGKNELGTSRFAYEWRSPGPSSMSDLGNGSAPEWRSPLDLERCKALLDDLFDGPRLERRVEAFALAMREADGKPFVLGTIGPGEARADSDWIDLHFGDDGLLAQDGPGDRTVHPFCSRRTRFSYEPQGALFRRMAGKYFDDGHGLETYAYTTIDGIVLPMRFASLDSGVLITLTVSDVEVNPSDLAGPTPEKPR